VEPRIPKIRNRVLASRHEAKAEALGIGMLSRAERRKERKKEKTNNDKVLPEHFRNQFTLLRNFDGKELDFNKHTTDAFAP